MSFTKTLWTETADLQETIRTMPFNTELAAGTLPGTTFPTHTLHSWHYRG